MSKLSSHLEVLPQTQQLLWPKLHPAAGLGYVLYGGTAIALRLGHRTSVDFDFFSDAQLDRRTLLATMRFLKAAHVIHDRPESLTCLVAPDARSSDTVKISFFGSISFGRAGAPQWTNDGVAQIASAEDLLGTQLKVVLQRIEAKDYIDIAAIVDSGTSLAFGLGVARALFGAALQPSECVKALVYFEGGDLEVLSQLVKSRLIAAVATVDDIPEVPLLHHRLSLQ